MYSIKKNMPLPKRARRSWVNDIPWDDLVIGDCIEIPVGKLTNVKSCRGDIYERSINLGMKVTTTVEGNILRMWRTK